MCEIAILGWMEDNALPRIARRLILRGMGEDRRKWERMGLGEEGTSAYASAQWRGGIRRRGGGAVFVLSGIFVTLR